MGSAIVGVVQQEDITFHHARRREGPHQPLGRELQGPQMDGDRGGLRNGLPAYAEEGSRGVEPFLHDW